MPGLEYKKLDLHVHTPASQCYLDKSHTAEQIVNSAIEKGLSGIAITDHNSAGWIDRIKDAAKKTVLVIFPGVEISTHEGFHLVAIFDPIKDQKHVEGFLGAIQFKPDEHGKPEATCNLSVYELIDTIHSWNGLAVFAHIDQTKGVFYESVKRIEPDNKLNVPINLRNLINDAAYDAVECVDTNYPEGFDVNHHIKRFPAFYQSSDNPDEQDPRKHSFNGIGSRYSSFKLDQIDLEGLRQCFSDPEVRIQLMGDHRNVGYSKILSMQIGNAGFFRNQKIDFHEGLNCLIGGKGVGKSLVIELLRFGLVQPPSDDSLLSDHVGKLEKRLEPGNFVELTFQTTEGTRYQIKHTYLGRKNNKSNEIKSEIVCKNLENGSFYEGDLQRMFRVLAYSQTEVIKITENKDAQLQLIDSFLDTRPIERKIVEVQEQLEENDTDLNSAILARSRLDSIQKEINTLDEEIESINKYLADPLFDAIKVMENKNSVFEDQKYFLNTLVKYVREWQNRTQELGLEGIPTDLSTDTNLINGQTIVNEAKETIRENLKKVSSELLGISGRWDDAYDVWKLEFDQVSLDYNKFLREIGGDREVKERERIRLERQLSEYRRNEQNYASLSSKLPNLLESRKKLLDQLEKSYRDLYEMRKDKYDNLTELSEQKLQLILNHAVDRSVYEEQLSLLLRGGQNAPTVSDRSKIAQGIMPRRFGQLVLDKNVTHLAEESDLSELWASRVIEKLWSSDDFSEVLALQHNCYPTDIPSIRFQKSEKVYEDLSELSIGQKCTALLIIALCDGTMPIIIDQPEDALDIISVWEDIAKKLRRGKNSRQFILTTHNSSVAVASDSDQFIVLEAEASNGRVVAAGAIDRPDVRQAVIDHLEGGDEPYKLRSRKYNIKK